MKTIFAKKETIADKILVHIALSKLTTVYETSKEVAESPASVGKAVRALEELGLIGRFKTRSVNGRANTPIYATSQGWFQAMMLLEVPEYEPRPGPWFLYHLEESNEGLLG